MALSKGHIGISPSGQKMGLWDQSQCLVQAVNGIDPIVFFFFIQQVKYSYNGIDQIKKGKIFYMSYHYAETGHSNKNDSAASY